MACVSLTSIARLDSRRAAGIVRDLNDAFRKTFAGGRVVVTTEVAALSDLDRIAVLEAVQAFSAFSTDNDPYGEHDFGAIDHGGQRYFWKIDAYDRRLEFGSPDPTDPSVTTRVLTVMRADEY